MFRARPINHSAPPGLEIRREILPVTKCAIARACSMYICATLAPEENSGKAVINTGLFLHSNESLGVGSQGATHPGTNQLLKTI
jgi:hypothetical protein